MLPRHGDYKIGIGRDLGLELSRGKIGCVGAHLLKDARRIPVYRVADHCAGPGTRCREVWNLIQRGVCASQSLRGGRAADVSGADEEDVQFGAPVWIDFTPSACVNVASGPRQAWPQPNPQMSVNAVRSNLLGCT